MLTLVCAIYVYNVHFTRHLDGYKISTKTNKI